MKVTKMMEARQIGIRFPIDYWVFIKQKSIREIKSLNEIVLGYVEKDMKKFSKNNEKKCLQEK